LLVANFSGIDNSAENNRDGVGVLGKNNSLLTLPAAMAELLKKYRNKNVKERIFNLNFMAKIIIIKKSVVFLKFVVLKNY